jgi:hypothetical protein
MTTKRFLKITSYSHTNGPDSRNVICIEIAAIYLYHSEYRINQALNEAPGWNCTRVHYYEQKNETNYKLLYCTIEQFESLIKGEIDKLFARTENSMLEYTITVLPA